MHKQLLTTAFAAFLGLALVLGIISPTAESEGAFETPVETVGEESTNAPSPVTEEEEETAPAPEETEAPSTTEPESEETAASEIKKEPSLPTLPEGAKELSLYINGRAIGEGFCFEKDGLIWLPVEGFGELFE